MKREKAIKYLKAVGYDKEILNNLIISFNQVVPEVPREIWREVLEGQNFLECYDELTDAIANGLEEEELDFILEFAESPVYAKIAKIVDEIDFADLGKQWLAKSRPGLAESISVVFPANGIDDNITQALIYALKQGAKNAS